MRCRAVLCVLVRATDGQTKHKRIIIPPLIVPRSDRTHSAAATEHFWAAAARNDNGLLVDPVASVDGQQAT